ncbi:MAG: hypothetical protein H7Y00_00215, partial [Fimbriimonadaceae bacterium]|nr:hypothetical protein [Chitinophagales bacterium]
MKTSILVILFFYTHLLYAQSDVLDLSFSEDGKLITTFYPKWSPPCIITVDHKINYIISQGDDGPAYSEFRYQLNEEGTPDTLLAAVGMQDLEIFELAYDDEYYGSVTHASLQSDGKILTAGYYSPSPFESFFVARNKTDGTLDSTFAVNGTFKTYLFPGEMNNIEGLLLQSDGKIILGINSWGSANSQVSI